MTTDTRKRLFGEVVDLLTQFTHDELRVFRLLAQRINTHRSQYGGLVIANDDRNHRAEAAMERADAVFYDMLHEVAHEDRRLERVRCFIADDTIARMEPGLGEIARPGIEEVE